MAVAVRGRNDRPRQRKVRPVATIAGQSEAEVQEISPEDGRRIVDEAARFYLV